MSVVDDPAPIAPDTSDAVRATAPGAPTAVELRAASVRHGTLTLLPPTDLRVAAGEVVAIVGRSGAGKTTLLHVIAGLLAPTSGTATAAPAALMPQRDGLMAWASARDNAALPLRVAGMPRGQARVQADRQLAALGLAGLEARRVGRLSGGQRQRVALARTLLTGRRLLLLDEPFAAVDALTRDELHDILLAQVGSEGRAAVLVTHDVEEAVRLADRLLVLTASEGLHAPRVALEGRPGQRLAQRGGEALRGAVLEGLGR